MKQMVDAEIKRLTKILVSAQEPYGSWSYPFDIGIETDCYMIILLRTLEINDEEFIQLLVRKIMSRQEQNGAWKLFYDEEEGNLALTVEAYYSLLYSGYLEKEDPRMQKAKQFILKNGGIEEVNMFTKVMLALTGQYKWPRFFPIPVEVILFPTWFPLHFFDLSMQARANLTPILILSDYKYSVRTYRSPDLSDLFLGNARHKEWGDWRELQPILSQIQQSMKFLIGYPRELHRLALQRAEQYMLARVESDGTFLSYYSSTFLMIFALMARGYAKEHPLIRKAVRGLKSFVTFYGGDIHAAYTTANVWNTTLAGYALQEAGMPYTSPTIQKSHEYLLSRQHMLYGDWAVSNPNAVPGGWGFSHINTMNPDVDDTTAALRSLRTFMIEKPKYRQSWDRAIRWIVSMQNNDGGWPAFERNVNKAILSWLPIEGNEGTMLDPSSADLTGRTLEFFGNFTHLNEYHHFIKRGVRWLLKDQRNDGSWYGRWGICFIYGTWSAVTGLTAVGVRKDHHQIRRAIKWLHHIQQQDGGWGESCLSDIRKEYVPLTESTRTHTAWALDALIAAEDQETDPIKRGVQYLIDTAGKNDWTQTYPKGQGLPGAFYIHYPSYEYIFPLLALSHYREKFCDSQ
ncbi:squalene--hopene cyclase [Pueribacillus theae]|uniref:Squalene--hopene cyclase n=2 Tax=Pueribacillus theae TaxID=2171751 RepID=A0A2U1K374_9BACI|nr:squalene--hopene cyclase [Pueribacillus theae]PWA11987.1 squalene--hopene cyclase [Pueribacillus theae]